MINGRKWQKTTKKPFWCQCDVIMRLLWRHNDPAGFSWRHHIKIVDIVRFGRLTPPFFMLVSWYFRISNFDIPYTIRTNFFIRKMRRMTNNSESSKITWRQLYLWRHLRSHSLKAYFYWKFNSLAKQWGVNDCYPTSSSYFISISMKKVFPKEFAGKMPTGTGKMLTSAKMMTSYLTFI